MHQQRINNLIKEANDSKGWSRIKKFIAVANEIIVDEWNYQFKNMTSRENDLKVNEIKRGVYVFYPNDPTKRKIITCSQNGDIRLFDSNLSLKTWRTSRIDAPIESIDHYKYRNVTKSNNDLIAVGTVNHKIYIFDWYGNIFHTFSAFGEIYALKFIIISDKLYLLVCGKKNTRGQLNFYYLGKKDEPISSVMQSDNLKKSITFNKIIWSIALDDNKKKIFLGAEGDIYVLSYDKLTSRINTKIQSIIPSNKSNLIGEVRSISLADLDNDGENEIIIGTTLKTISILKFNEDKLIIKKLPTNGWIRRICIYKSNKKFNILGCTDTGTVYLYDSVNQSLDFNLKWIFKTYREIREVYPILEIVDFGSKIPVVVFVSRYGGVCAKKIYNPGNLLSEIRKLIKNNKKEVEKKLNINDLKLLSLYIDEFKLFPKLNENLLNKNIETINNREVNKDLIFLLKTRGIHEWTFNTNNRVRSVAVCNNVKKQKFPIIIGGWGPGNGGIVCLSYKGQKLWDKQLKHWGFSVEAGYVGDLNNGEFQIIVGANSVIGYNENGDELWNYSKEIYVGGAICIHHGLVFTGSVEGEIYVFDGKSTNKYVARSQVIAGKWIRSIKCKKIDKFGKEFLVITGDEIGNATFVRVNVIKNNSINEGIWDFQKIGIISTQGFISESIDIRRINKTTFNVIIGSTDGKLYSVNIDLIENKIYSVWDSNEPDIFNYPDWIKGLKIFDIDGDGESEIIIGCVDKNIYISDLKGKLKFMFYCGDEARGVAAFDVKINGRKSSYIISGSEAGNIYCFRFIRDDELTHLNLKLPEYKFSIDELKKKEKNETLEYFYEEIRKILPLNSKSKILELTNIIKDKIFNYTEIMDEETVKNIKKIAVKVKEGKCIPFIGAGMSAEAGAPTGVHLKNLICDELKVAYDYFNDLEEAAHFFATIKSERYMVNFVKKKINDLIKEKKVHPIGLTFLKLLNMKKYITTNYDNLIEKQYPKSQVIVIAKPIDFLFSEAKNRIEIYKIHGDFEHRQNLVISFEQSLMHGLANEDIEFKIRSLFFENTILFLGYSFNNYEIHRLYYRIQSKNINSRLKREYIILHEDDKYTNSRKEILKSIKLNVIKCDTRLFLLCLWCEYNNISWRKSFAK